MPPHVGYLCSKAERRQLIAESGFFIMYHVLERNSRNIQPDVKALVHHDPEK